jgi:UDP-N-acetylglucosamine acyltransferase
MPERTAVAQIHPTAVVDPSAELGPGVSVGPFCIVEAGAAIGEGTVLEARSVVKSRAALGRFNEVGEGVVIGGQAQHVQVQRPGGKLVIGDCNRFRENVTVHRGWADGGTTTIGDHNMFMVGAHVGHDCRIGNHCIVVNQVLLGGHVTVDDRAYVGGGVGVHQFCRIGRLAMIGGLSKVTQDVPPFVLIDDTQVVGLNRIGLKRNGYTPADVLQLKEAYRIIYRQGLRWNEVLAILKEQFTTGPAALFHEFLKQGKRGFIQERRISRKATLKIVDPAHDDIDESAHGRDAA